MVVSAEQSTRMKVEMLTLCDDYLVKPFSLAELIARLRAVSRRGSVLAEDIFVAGPLTLDVQRYRVLLNGELVLFRDKEFALLEYLVRNQGIVLSREMILSHVWDMHADPFTNTVDTHIRLLRKKLEVCGWIFIHTIPKRGYRFFPEG